MSARQKSVLGAWVDQARLVDLLAGLEERTYTLRKLVDAMHRADLAETHLSYHINKMAARTWQDGKSLQ